MGWNFVVGLSKFHEVHVISEKLKWEKQVNDYLKEHPSVATNLKFYFILKKRNKALRKIWPPSYYWYYRDWQKKAYRLTVQLNSEEDFDVIHQLNMVGYREPGYLWKINKPLVWGPIGGLENSPWSFLPSLGIKGMIYYSARNLINLWQRNYLNRPKKVAKHTPSKLIAATSSNAELIKKIWKRNAVIISEVGKEENVRLHTNLREQSEPLRIVFSGLHTPGKNLPLLLKALAMVKFPFELHILGLGEMTKEWKSMAAKLKIAERCIWYGWLDKEVVMEKMQLGHVFCITSISDLTSTVTLEALSNALPIICLDHCGFSKVVNETCGIKVPVDNPKKAAINFARALTKLYEDEILRRTLSEGALKRASDFSWEKKIEKLNRIYIDLVDGK